MSQNEAIFVPGAFTPPAPLSPGIRRGPFLWISGQVPVDRVTFESAGDGIAEQTQITLENLLAVAEAGGATLADIVKTTVFLTDMDDFATMNEAYVAAFGDHRPARSTIGVAALPLAGAAVEIEAWARKA